MSWRDEFLPKPSSTPVPEQPAPTRRPLRVGELLAILLAINGRTDGCLPVMDYEAKEPRDVKLLTPGVVQAAQALPDPPPWATQLDVTPSGDGWLAVTDPTTSQIHEIRREDAPHAWRKRR